MAYQGSPIPTVALDDIPVVVCNPLGDPVRRLTRAARWMSVNSCVTLNLVLKLPNGAELGVPCVEGMTSVGELCQVVGFYYPELSIRCMSLSESESGPDARVLPNDAILSQYCRNKSAVWVHGVEQPLSSSSLTATPRSLAAFSPPRHKRTLSSSEFSAAAAGAGGVATSTAPSPSPSSMEQHRPTPPPGHAGSPPPRRAHRVGMTVDVSAGEADDVGTPASGATRGDGKAEASTPNPLSALSPSRGSRSPRVAAASFVEAPHTAPGPEQSPSPPAHTPHTPARPRTFAPSRPVVAAVASPRAATALRQGPHARLPSAGGESPRLQLSAVAAAMSPGEGDGDDAGWATHDAAAAGPRLVRDAMRVAELATRAEGEASPGLANDGSGDAVAARGAEHAGDVGGGGSEHRHAGGGTHHTGAARQPHHGLHTHHAHHPHRISSKVAMTVGSSRDLPLHVHVEEEEDGSSTRRPSFASPNTHTKPPALHTQPRDSLDVDEMVRTLTRDETVAFGPELAMKLSSVLKDDSEGGAAGSGGSSNLGSDTESDNSSNGGDDDDDNDGSGSGSDAHSDGADGAADSHDTKWARGHAAPPPSPRLASQPSHDHGAVVASGAAATYARQQRASRPVSATTRRPEPAHDRRPRRSHGAWVEPGAGASDPARGHNMEAPAADMYAELAVDTSVRGRGVAPPHHRHPSFDTTGSRSLPASPLHGEAGVDANRGPQPRVQQSRSTARVEELAQHTAAQATGRSPGPSSAREPKPRHSPEFAERYRRIGLGLHPDEPPASAVMARAAELLRQVINRDDKPSGSVTSRSTGSFRAVDRGSGRGGAYAASSSSSFISRDRERESEIAERERLRGRERELAQRQRHGQEDRRAPSSGRSGDHNNLHHRRPDSGIGAARLVPRTNAAALPLTGADLGDAALVGSGSGPTVHGRRASSRATKRPSRRPSKGSGRSKGNPRLRVKGNSAGAHVSALPVGVGVGRQRGAWGGSHHGGGDTRRHAKAQPQQAPAAGRDPRVMTAAVKALNVVEHLPVGCTPEATLLGHASQPAYGWKQIHTSRSSHGHRSHHAAGATGSGSNHHGRVPTSARGHSSGAGGSAGGGTVEDVMRARLARRRSNAPASAGHGHAAAAVHTGFAGQSQAMASSAGGIVVLGTDAAPIHAAAGATRAASSQKAQRPARKAKHKKRATSKTKKSKAPKKKKSHGSGHNDW